MATSRRDFLKKGSLVALVAGVPLGIAEKIVATEINVTPSKNSGLTLAAFERQLNTTFSIHGRRKTSVKLVAVDDLRRKGTRAQGKECFGLQFRGSYPNALKQNTYVIEHEKLGVFSFLLVPIGMKDKDAPYYEAIINHLHS